MDYFFVSFSRSCSGCSHCYGFHASHVDEVVPNQFIYKNKLKLTNTLNLGIVCLINVSSTL